MDWELKRLERMSLEASEPDTVNGLSLYGRLNLLLSFRLSFSCDSLKGSFCLFYYSLEEKLTNFDLRSDKITR